MSVLNLNSISITPKVLKEIGFSNNPKTWVYHFILYPHRVRLLINKKNINEVKVYFETSYPFRAFVHEYTQTYEVSEKIDILVLIESCKTKIKTKYERTKRRRGN